MTKTMDTLHPIITAMIVVHQRPNVSQMEVVIAQEIAASASSCKKEKDKERAAVARKQQPKGENLGVAATTTVVVEPRLLSRCCFGG